MTIHEESQLVLADIHHETVITVNGNRSQKKTRIFHGIFENGSTGRGLSKIDKISKQIISYRSIYLHYTFPCQPLSLFSIEWHRLCRRGKGIRKYAMEVLKFRGAKIFQTCLNRRLLTKR